MSHGCQLKGHQTKKPYRFCPCYILVNYPALKFIHLAKHQPMPTRKKNSPPFLFQFGLHSIPSSSPCCSTTIFYLFLSNYESLSTSSFVHSSFHLVENLINGQSIDFLHFINYSIKMTKNKMQRAKWERASHIYSRWANWIVCETQYWFLDIHSNDALCFFVGFWKCIVAKTRHWFPYAFSTFFFVGF